MRGSNKLFIPQSKKSFKKPQLIAPVNALDEKTAKTFYENQKVLLEHFIELKKHVFSIKRDMRKIIEEEVTKQFDNKKIMLEGLYKEILIEKRLLQKKGQIKQEDINKMYEELKKKNG